MDLSEIILKPVLTEKGLKLREEGIWSFFVNPKATKGAVCKAAEEFFGVHPYRVRMITVKSKTKQLMRQRRRVTLKGAKKALLWLPEGEKIKNV